MELAQLDREINRVYDVDNAFAAYDKQLHVRFFVHTTQDNSEKAEEERKRTGKKATYIPCDFIEIQKRGEKDILRRPVWVDEYNQNADNNRFREKYEAFKSGREDTAPRGKLLAECGFVAPHTAAELAHEKIFTVEHLACLDDGVASRFMGGNTLKAKAKAYLDLSAAKDAPGSDLELKQKVAAQDVELAEMRLKLEALSNPEATSKPRSKK